MRTRRYAGFGGIWWISSSQRGGPPAPGSRSPGIPAFIDSTVSQLIQGISGESALQDAAQGTLDAVEIVRDLESSGRSTIRAGRDMEAKQRVPRGDHARHRGRVGLTVPKRLSTAR